MFKYWNIAREAAQTSSPIGNMILGSYFVIADESQEAAVERLAAASGIADGQNINALAHSAVSAWSAYLYSEESAAFLGNAKEWSTLDRADPSDTFKDMWNNEIGRQIGQYSRQNGLSLDDATSLVLEAYFDNRLIRSNSDSRIDTSFSGRPDEFSNNIAIWGGRHNAELAGLNTFEYPMVLAGRYEVMKFERTASEYFSEYFFGPAIDQSPGVGQYLINRFSEGQPQYGGVPYQSDGIIQPEYQSWAYNTFGSMNDSSFVGSQSVDAFPQYDPLAVLAFDTAFQLSTFGTDPAGAWAALPSDFWAKQPFTFDAAALSWGSLDGIGGYDLGTFNVPVIDLSPVTGASFSPDLYTLPDFSQSGNRFANPIPASSGPSVSVSASGSPDDFEVRAEVTVDLGEVIGAVISIVAAVFGGLFGLPVVLDLDGNDITITPLQSSNMYFDMMGDHFQHRTAWAGAGDGVLVLDADGDGVIDQRKEVVFTDWDPTAATDMEALHNVFDTNHDGRLDAGDAQFSSFKIMVTNADGTTTLKTLADAGVQSIDLILSGAANDNAPMGGAVAA